MPNKVRGFRKAINDTQLDFAVLIGASQSTYSKKERGKSEFKKSEMEKITIRVSQFYPNITLAEIFF